jgi:glutamine amidotransferase-like uncharacterized protein
MAAQLSPIYIYQSPSIAPICADHLEKKMKESGTNPSRIIRVNDPSYLKRELLQTDQGTLVIPGAINTFRVSDEMQEQGLIESVRKAIKKGWSYLGSCAGANLAGRTMVMHNQKTPSGISATINVRDLGISFLDLLPIQAHIPVYPIEKTNCEGGSNGRMIPVLSDDGETFESYWNEGSSFEILDPSVKPVAYYADFGKKSVAAVNGSFGEGSVVATAIHPELVNEPAGKFDSGNQKFLRKIFDITHITYPLYK